MHNSFLEVRCKYKVLRSLSLHSEVYLCNEDATNRLLVIKKFPQNKLNFFYKEATALNDLALFEHAPRPYFTSKTEEGGIIGMEYKFGKPLEEMITRNNHNPQMKEAIFDKINQMISKLHKDFRRAHGDINCRNVLVGIKSQKVEISLLDWEFSEKIEEENIGHYTKFRGTIGVNPKFELCSLVNRDRKAVESLMSELFQGKIPTKKKRIFDRINPWT